MIVQIYEIQTPQEAARCIELGVDHVGSVLLSLNNWRQPMIKEAIGLSEGTRTKNSLIPLFQERDPLFRALDYYRPHLVHFCENLSMIQGQEKEVENLTRLQSELKGSFPDIKIIRSLPVPVRGKPSQSPAVQIVRRLEQVTDYFLIDTWLEKEPVNGFVGLTGRVCDWDKAEEIVGESRLPVIMAGGLSAENVYYALLKTRPAGADSCTQTNKRDQKGNPIRFRKDFERVKRFVEEVRRAERDLSIPLLK